MNKETFGAFVANTRREVGLTQRSLAEKLHVTDKAVSKWERGLCYPDVTLSELLWIWLAV
ncbi:MAG: helix-turn-helix domain-containing protein, partial [Oscillospiraceae bacterium]|nr:helix-turn-helix domain-containing protein [Oscillospiraceae bacterium]